MSEHPKIRFGIVGCADIARKVSRAILLAPSATIVAVGSRSLEKAAAFAKANNLPETAKTYGSYEAVLDDPDVDAVYMPLPTGLHLKWAVLAARKKKHLLLEKPVALNVGEFDEILKEVESNGLQIMDCTMWVHNPRTEKMRAFLNDSSGPIKSISSIFTFLGTKDFLQNDIRVKPGLDGLGALGDIGWYCIRSILWANNFQLPSTVLALPGPARNAAGIIMACGASLFWEDGRTATLHCSFLSSLTMELTVVGTEGTLHVSDFVVPFEENKANFTTSVGSGFNDLVTGWDPRPVEHSVSVGLPQEALMVEEFARLVGRVKFEGASAEKKWAVYSWRTQRVVDAVKESVEKGCVVVKIDDGA